MKRGEFFYLPNPRGKTKVEVVRVTKRRIFYREMHSNGYVHEGGECWLPKDQFLWLMAWMGQREGGKGSL